MKKIAQVGVLKYYVYACSFVSLPFFTVFLSFTVTFRNFLSHSLQPRYRLQLSFPPRLYNLLCLVSLPLRVGRLFGRSEKAINSGKEFLFFSRVLANKTYILHKI